MRMDLQISRPDPCKFDCLFIMHAFVRNPEQVVFESRECRAFTSNLVANNMLESGCLEMYSILIYCVSPIVEL